MDDINFESELDILFDDFPAPEVPTEEEIPQAAEPQEAPVKTEHRKAPARKKAAPKPVFKKPAAKKETPKQTRPAPKAPAVRSNSSTAKPPQRRKRLSKQDQFKQNVLPLIILAVAALLIVVFIIGSITRAVQKSKVEKEASIAASESIAAEQARLEAEMNTILAEAEVIAAGFDYDGAIALIDSFSGNIGGFPKLQDTRAQYELARTELIPWEDPNTIVNLSVQTLLADVERAFSNEGYGTSLKRSFITIPEFETILQRLYDNGYILVGIEDLVETDSDGNFTYKPLMLPEGKKPLVLTQTNVNYNLYLVDSDNDMVADKDGAGIASKLVLDTDGSVTCEIVNADGTISTGNYDMIPILDDFVDAHPDFSYRGAKAVLALTGYNGLFGYRTDDDGREKFGEEQYEKDVAAVKEIAETLTASGYELACYTYGNNAYGNYSLTQIQAEMNKWNEEVVPILGNIKTMVFAQKSDINSGVLYSGEKFEYLQSVGFEYFVGYCTEGDPFTFISEKYIRQGRLLITGEDLSHNKNWYTPFFDTADLLDPAREN